MNRLLLMIFITKIMTYYELCKNGKSAEYKQKDSVIFTSIQKVQDQQYLIILIQSGYIDVFEQHTLSHIGNVRLKAEENAVRHIIASSICGSVAVVQTFTQIYLLNIKIMLEVAISKKETNFQINQLKFSQAQVHIGAEFKRLMNKQFKLLYHRQRLCLKIIGRSKEQISYLFCIVKENELSVDEIYKIRLKNEYKASLQGVGKDFILYESYVNKFKPIKAHLVSYHSHHQARDTQMAEDYEIYQFQERCCVNNVYKISAEVLCIITSSHFESQSQSNIVLFNSSQKYTMNNIVLKEFLVFSATLSGLSGVKQMTYGNMNFMVQCLGHEDKVVALRQVLPFAGNSPASTFLPPSDHYQTRRNSLILHSRERKEIAIYEKISKKAIYLSWLKQEFQNASGIFSNILELL